MSADQPEPLWREVVGDTEPWRRGRIFLVVFAILTFVNQALLFGLMVLNGAIESLLSFGITAAFFWLLFYLIWIGVHWVRWFTAFCWAAWGFALLIWAFRDSSAIEMISGTYAMVVGACLGFVPSVYFFALRQREAKRWFEATAVAVVILLLVGSLTIGIMGLAAYKSQLHAGAQAFGDEAFKRLFTEHDTYFLLERTSNDLAKREGRLRLTKFLQHATINAGDVRDIHPAAASLWFSYVFPFALRPHAELAAEGNAIKGPVELHMRIEQPAGEWKIDSVWWFDPRSVRQRTPRHG